MSFEVSELAVELRADLGGGERSLVALIFREFALTYHHLRAHETDLQVYIVFSFVTVAEVGRYERATCDAFIVCTRQVSLHSVTMEDLTKEPESRHRVLLASHSPPAPRKSLFLSKSCPELRARGPPAPPGAPGAPLHYMKPLTSSLPAAINKSDVANTEVTFIYFDCGKQIYYFYSISWRRLHRNLYNFHFFFF